MGNRRSARKAPEDVRSLPTPEPSSQPQVDTESPSDQLHPSIEPAPMPVSDDEDEMVTPLSKKRKTTGGVTSLSTPLRRSARFTQSSPTPTVPIDQESPVASADHNVDSDLGQAESTDEDGDILASAPAKRRRVAKPTKQADFNGPEVDEDNWLVGDNEVEYISSGSEPVRKRKRRSRRDVRREQEELEADVDDLQDSDAEGSISADSATKRRTRGGPVTTQRDGDQEHFALLRRRRAGEKIPRVHDSDEEDESADGIDINLIGRPSQPSDQGSVHSSLDTGPEHDEEVVEEVAEDWIEEDSQENTESRRPQSDIPLEFTNFAKAPPKELFFHVVEWLVKNRIAPAFPRDDEIFRLAFRKVDDEVSAQAGSRLISSAWNAEFKYTILARPEAAISSDVPSWDATCDACNKTNHPAKYDFVLTGQPYYQKTLEPVDHDSDEEETGDVDVDEKGHIIASESRHFYLGTHCAANAQMGHKLTHWKYHLNETVLQYLTEQDVLSDQQIVARERKNKKAREKEAEAIVDTMEETGKIKELWSEFQGDLRDSRLGMSDYDSKARGKGRVGKVRTYVDGYIKEWNGDKYSMRRDTSMSADSD